MQNQIRIMTLNLLSVSLLLCTTNSCGKGGASSACSDYAKDTCPTTCTFNPTSGKCEDTNPTVLAASCGKFLTQGDCTGPACAWDPAAKTCNKPPKACSSFKTDKTCPYPQCAWDGRSCKSPDPNCSSTNSCETPVASCADYDLAHFCAGPACVWNASRDKCEENVPVTPPNTPPVVVQKFTPCSTMALYAINSSGTTAPPATWTDRTRNTAIAIVLNTTGFNSGGLSNEQIASILKMDCNYIRTIPAFATITTTSPWLWPKDGTLRNTAVTILQNATSVPVPVLAAQTNSQLSKLLQGKSPNCDAGASCRVFVSSADTTGKIVDTDGLDLVGTAAADSICSRLATTAFGRLSNYKAWIWDEKTLNGNPINDPASTFTQSAKPYVLVNNTVVAANWTKLTSGNLDNAIRVNEKGIAEDVYVWTNVFANGKGFLSGTKGCNAWTLGSGGAGNAGYSQYKGSDWSAYANSYCGNTYRLYCFEQ